MRKFLPVSAALVLITVAAAGAAGPELKTEDQKTLYALGLVISQNLASFNLNAVTQELESPQFSAAHFATHGEFNQDHSKSFILTYDDWHPK